MAVLRDTDDAESRETGKWWHYYGIDKPPTLGVRPLIDDSDSQYFWNRQQEMWGQTFESAVKVGGV